MRLTLPQILMLNHAAHVNRQRLDKQMDAKKDGNALERIEASFHEEQPIWRGKKWSEMTSEDMATYVQE